MNKLNNTRKAADQLYEGVRYADEKRGGRREEGSDAMTWVRLWHTAV